MPDNKNRTRKSVVGVSQEENYAHLQPQAPELERAVLGALMIDSEAFESVAEMLKPESFYERKHQLVYEAIRLLASEQNPVDMLTVTNKLKALGTLDEVGGPYYVAQLCEGVTNAAHIVYHAAIIAQKSLARQLISYTSEIQTLAFDETKDVQELMQDAEGKLFEISKQNIKKEYTQIGPVIDESLKRIYEAAKEKKGLSGIPTLFRKLDKMTSGWQKSNLIIIAARPGMGKTAFALSMAKQIAIDQGIPMAFFTLEMSNVELVNRIISNVCEIKSEHIRNGQLDPHEWVQLDVKTKGMMDKPLYIDETPSLSIFELRTKARRLKSEKKIELIMIDYLQLMNASGARFGSRQEEVSTISRSLKALAKDLDIPIIALSQLNRNAEQRATMPGAAEGIDASRPQLSDLRESGAIEQDADMVIFIHRPEYYKIRKNPDGTDTKGEAEIIIAKHRNGEVGSVWLKFESEYARFCNKDDDQLRQGGRERASNAKSIEQSTSNPEEEPSGDPFGPVSSDENDVF